MAHTLIKNRRLSLALAGIVFLAACAPAAQQAPAPAPAAPKAPQAPAPPAAPQAPVAAPSPATPTPTRLVAQEEKPTYGGQLVFVQNRDIGSLDPLASQLTTSPERISLVYPRLIVYDRQDNEAYGDTRPKPSYMTESWAYSADGKALTFKLKKGIKYQKLPPVNGRELVAADIKYSIERYMNHPQSTFKSRYVDIDSIETPDNYTVVFKLKKPSAYVLYALAAEPSFITPKEVEDKDGDFKQTLVGPGPFIHEKTIPGEGSTFHKNPDYVDASHIYADRYIFKVITDPSTSIAAMRAGQFDFGGAIITSASQRDAILKTNSDLKYVETLNLAWWLAMRTDKEPFKDLRVRRAISKAIDREELIGRLYEGVAFYTGAVPIGFGKWALSDKEIRAFDAFKYDPVAAKKLLTEAGFPQGFLVKFYIAPKTVVPAWATGGEIIGEMLNKNLGIKPEFSSAEYTTFSNICYNGRQDQICVWGLGLGADASDYLRAQYYAGGYRNAGHLENPKVDAMIDEVAATLDEGERVKKVRDIQTYLYENVLSMLYLPAGPSYSFYGCKLKNYRPGLRPYGAEYTAGVWKATKC